MKKLAKVLTAALCLSFCAAAANAQNVATTYDPAKYRKEPVWIAMMDDPGANYYETLKAFREFWKGYRLPGEPEEMEERDKFEVLVGLEPEKPKKRDEKEREREKREKKIRKGPDYSYQVKRFKGWIKNVQPWVQEDGHILTDEERQAILDRQQKELREIESKQKN